MKTTQTLYFDIPFEQKDDVKALGAKWNPDEKSWYVPAGIDLKPFEHYLDDTQTITDTPLNKFKGQRGIGGLFISTVPSSTDYLFLKDMLTTRLFNKLDKAVQKREGSCCSICKAKMNKSTNNFHEVWEFDLKTHYQKLTNIITICQKCRLAKKYWSTSKTSKAGATFEHLMNVNNWTAIQTVEHIKNSYERFYLLNNEVWRLHEPSFIQTLKSFGVKADAIDFV